MSCMPGCAWRRRAMRLVTLCPGSWPPSPGFEPCAILICSSYENDEYSAVKPKRPDATWGLREVPTVRKDTESAPPSPQLECLPWWLDAVAISSRTEHTTT